jgi:hydrogenase maturation protease
VSGQQATTLVACAGNLLMGDDGAGVHAARELEARAAGRFDVADAGTSLSDVLLTRPLYGRLIVVDAIRKGGAPGSIYEARIADPEWLARESPPVSLHDLGVGEALWQARLAGKLPREVWIVGVEPERVEWGIGLSPAVQAALPRLIERACELALAEF